MQHQDEHRPPGEIDNPVASATWRHRPGEPRVLAHLLLNFTGLALGMAVITGTLKALSLSRPSVSWRPRLSWPSWLRLRRAPKVSAAQAETWRSRKSAGKEAYRQGDLVEAEHHFSEALKMAESFGLRDARLAATLNNLALVFKRQGKFGKAEMCLRRALRIYEAQRPQHAHVARVLQNLAALYAVQGKEKEAKELRLRALAILQDL